jgi:hypothetical protein
VAQTSTRVPFSEARPQSYFVLEQFWGRAARALRVRKNPNARLISPLDRALYPSIVYRSVVDRSVFIDTVFDPTPNPMLSAACLPVLNRRKAKDQGSKPGGICLAWTRN